MKSETLAVLLRTLILLNVVDTILTIIVVGLKWATEVNPIMDYFLQQGPIIFGLTKFTMTLAGTFLLWKARKSIWSIRAAGALTACYALVVAYEMAMIVAMVTTG